jgi:hypothetical protein
MINNSFSFLLIDHSHFIKTIGDFTVRYNSFGNTIQHSVCLENEYLQKKILFYLYLKSSKYPKKEKSSLAFIDQQCN